MSAAQIRALYTAKPDRLAQARTKFGRALTLAEKILVAHCWNLEEQPWGFREFSVCDRDGNLVTFFEPPSEYDPRAGIDE